MLMQNRATILLTRQGSAVTSAVAVPRWRVESDGVFEIMRTTVEFGPFAGDAEFDGAMLTVAGGTEPVEFPSMVRLPAGMTFTHDVELRFTRDG